MSSWKDSGETWILANWLIQALEEACFQFTMGKNISNVDPFLIFRETLLAHNLTDDTQLEGILQSLTSSNLNSTYCQSNRTRISDSYDDSIIENRYEPSMDHNFVLLFNFWMLGVIMPLISTFGIIANSASIVVLTRPIMRSSTINIYLAGLSGFDSLLLLMSLLLYPSLSFCELDSTDPKSPWCRYFFFSALFTYPLSLIMQSCSVWTLTAITVDRFLAISWPLRSRDWCTCKRAYIVLAAIAIWSVFYNLPAFFELQLKTIHWISPDKQLSIFPNNTENLAIFATNYEESHFVLDQTDLRKQPVYKLAYKGYCYLFFMLLIPAGAMVVLNLFVSIKVRRAYRWRRAMSGKEEKERRCTIMAVLVVVTFLVFNSLAFVNNMIEIFSSDDENSTKSTSYLLSVSVGNVLVALNSATNFVIYCALGLRFRVMFCKIFCMEKCMESQKSNDRRSLRGSGCHDRPYQWVAVRYSVRGNWDNSSRNGSERGRFLQMKHKFTANSGSLNDISLRYSCNNDQQNAFRRSQ